METDIPGSSSPFPLGHSTGQGRPVARRRRAVPDRIQRYYIPSSVVKVTQDQMRRFGKERRECYIWWGGYFTTEEEGQVLTALCPNIATKFGRIHLTNPELVTLHNRLRSLDQVLLIELHTHPPGAGGQNEVDAAHPASTHHGFISIVVPDFGFLDLRHLEKTYVYEYIGSGQWRELDSDEIKARFVIEEPLCIVKV